MLPHFGMDLVNKDQNLLEQNILIFNPFSPILSVQFSLVNPGAHRQMCWRKIASQTHVPLFWQGFARSQMFASSLRLYCQLVVCCVILGLVAIDECGLWLLLWIGVNGRICGDGLVVNVIGSFPLFCVFHLLVDGCVKNVLLWVDSRKSIKIFNKFIISPKLAICHCDSLVHFPDFVQWRICCSLANHSPSWNKWWCRRIDWNCWWSIGPQKQFFGCLCCWHFALL